jgi:hypothetical protein
VNLKNIPGIFKNKSDVKKQKPDGKQKKSDKEKQKPDDSHAKLYAVKPANEK